MLAITELTKTMNNISSAITDLNINVNQLLFNSNEREKPHQFDCGLSSQQFPLSSEEELQMLDSGLQQKETRDRFVSALTNRFLSSVNEKDVGELYDIATQGYLHDIRDKMIKRNRRKQDQSSRDDYLNSQQPNERGLRE
ncbi:unnamed protein product [Schistosoma margrebowiei]|uniref:Uncharacterized protein n=1 Tax=Schistosoma margrebowiei TaxID=48269 RepID=A0A183LVI9_9TREM|nr:unnamed protein product [Schistosoma margrebowiei]